MSLLGFVIGATIGAILAWTANSAPYPPFKGWWFFAFVMYVGILGGAFI